jgi:predicted site-specific integrase-resolvase
MIENVPNCDPNSVFSVKRTCAELGVSRKTLKKYRDLGILNPINPDNHFRPKYTGQSIIDCWNKAVML